VSPSRSLSETIEWMNDGTLWFQGHVGQLSDLDLAKESRLPGWTRAHLVAHMAQNADALGRLLSWASSGIETPMYATPEQRSEEIEVGALAPPADLRQNLGESAQRLERAVADLPETAWSAEVRSALGRIIPASEVPWLRTREVWLHTVDLDSGARLAEIPEAVVLALIEDIVATFSSREGFPPMQLQVWRLPGGSSNDNRYSIGEGGPEISGSGPDLLDWLSGRSSSEALFSRDAVPTLPRWL
jgi:maleylpyruvate isomerase